MGVGAFGAQLRRLRVERGRSLGSLAFDLGVSIPYIADVERGRRAPLAHEQILAAAAALDCDHPTTLALHRAAAHDRGFVRLPVEPEGLRAELATELEIRWTALGDESLASLRDLLRNGG